MLLSLLADAVTVQPGDAFNWAAAALALGTLLANGWGIWVRRLERQDELRAENEKAAQEGGIIGLKGQVDHLLAVTADCHKDRDEQKAELASLRAMIMSDRVDHRAEHTKDHPKTRTE